MRLADQHVVAPRNNLGSHRALPLGGHGHIKGSHSIIALLRDIADA
jgi:hypothetical protein